MKALTLWRPWSDAIVRGSKRVENRPWAPPASALGQVIAIHAGARFDSEAFAGLREKASEVGVVLRDSTTCPMGIVGTARLVGWLDLRGVCLPGPTVEERYDRAYVAALPGETTHPPSAAFRARVARTLRLDDDLWWAGPVGWLLDDVVAIDPVPCRGALGLWSMPADVEAVVRERVAAAHRASRLGEVLP